MVSVAVVADEHQRRLITRLAIAESRALRLWGRVDVNDLDASWDALGPAITSVGIQAQMQSVAASGVYVSAAERAQGFSSAGVRVNMEALAGVDGSGRDLGGLLRGSISTTKERIGAGAGGGNALLSGAAYLAAMMKTAIADVSRSSDLVAASGKGFTSYVRAINPGACDRCALLAGVSSYKIAFRRHPSCKCTAVPLANDGAAPAGLFNTAEEYFESLSKAEQDRIFTEGGAEAIRSGARISTVVSARRGARGISFSNRLDDRVGRGAWRRMERTTVGFRPDGSPIQVFTTSEGTTRRGVFGRNAGVGTVRDAGARYSRTTRLRLMPESIVDLTDDPDLRKVLLRDAGYLDYPIQNYSSNAWIAEHRIIRANERRIADEFYRSLGATI